MPRNTVPLPGYPEILLEPISGPVAPGLPPIFFDHSGRRDRAREIELFSALCRHYEIPGCDPVEPTLPTQRLWALLGMRLAQDFVPAYRTPKRAGRPRTLSVTATDEEIAEYLSAGGSPAFARQMALSYVQARFVGAIRELAPRPSEAFRRLIGGMPEARRLRGTLPKRYAKLMGIKALEAAWAAIPKFLRENPENFIPASSRTKGTIKTGKL